MPGQSYLDPVYDRYEQDAARQAGIDPSLLHGIRTRGERSNADQVSSAGARTVYQITPPTRAGIMKNYGFDPYSSGANAALGAALLMKEGLKRNHGDAEAAVGEYHGGIDRRQWGPVNAAYRARVLGRAPSAQPASSMSPGASRYSMLAQDDTQFDADALQEALTGLAGGNARTAGATGAQATSPRPIESAFANLYQPQPHEQGPSNGDWNGWLDGYIRDVLKNA
jgi:hypothetical protein